jgi:integrase
VTPKAPLTAGTDTKQSNSGEAETPTTDQRKPVPITGERKMMMTDKTRSVPARALYDVPEAMVMLNLSRTQIYELMLAEKARTLSTDTVHRLLSILRRSIRRAQGRDLVRRNVALLCEPPRGTGGRPSKSLTLDQANAVLAAAAGTSMHAYVVLSLLTGARTEELRALTWTHLDLDGDPPTIELWHSVRGER